MKYGVQNVCFFQGIANGGGHKDHQNGWQDADNTVKKRFPQILSGHSAKQAGRNACCKKHDSHDHHGIILQRRNKAGTKDDGDTGSQNTGKAPQTPIHFGNLNAILRTDSLQRPLDSSAVTVQKTIEQQINQNKGQQPQPYA